MLNNKILVISLTVSVAFCTAVRHITGNPYEETVSYSCEPECRPSNLDKGVKCSAIGPTIKIKGGFDTNCGIYYMSLASAYHVARFADAMGYQDNCQANKTFLETLNIIAAWSGKDNFIAIDLACNFERQVVRKCATVPTSSHTYICLGLDGPPGTYGKRLGTATYNAVLQATNNRWVLFLNCWIGKTHTGAAFDVATSFNVFNLDAELSFADMALIISELNRRGFNTHPSNIIKFDFNNTQCN
ncbi:uncharacterized protein LOC119074372 [Bradysia coprophila]|uniref:uncharacterized protein LOC119074372 n=1 Tax=Bradysia coprophila TaxID=38358 RepID=UPI00187DC69A|nr:uncharacterized protein LOC119074372 [Bradysia coprophila]